MAKLKGQAKIDFLERMQKGRDKAAREERSKTKRRKASKKKFVRGKRTTAKQPKKSKVKPRTTRRSRGGSVSDVNKSLLLDDIAKLGISSKNKNKVVSIITNRLRV